MCFYLLSFLFLFYIYFKIHTICEPPVIYSLAIVPEYHIADICILLAYSICIYFLYSVHKLCIFISVPYVFHDLILKYIFYILDTFTFFILIWS